MDQPDQDLYAWIIGRQPAPAAFDTPMMRLCSRLLPVRERWRIARDLGA